MSQATTESRYILDNAWQHERERLEALERVYDPGTIRRLEALGVSSGWNCLEVAAGGGSIAQWLADRVSPGTIVATDIDTRFIEQIEKSNLTVLKHDVFNDDLPEGEFDLVHTRLFLEHFPNDTTVVPKLVSALKPGGWLVVEDIDWLTAISVREDLTFDKVINALKIIFSTAGYDTEFGRKLPARLNAAGLLDVDADGAVSMNRDSGRRAWSLLFEQLGEGMIGSGLVIQDDIDAVMAKFDDPDEYGISPLMITCWGRKPS